jgi:hypothetical protein
MSHDLIDMSNDVFDDWLRDISGRAAGGDLSEERLVELVGTTLREVTPEARAKGFIDLANLCYAMADKALGSQTPLRKCLEVVVSVSQRH